jgi:flagellar motility protein MotE (MotC chaperone)
LVSSLCFCMAINAQQESDGNTPAKSEAKVNIEGTVYSAIITEEGDTLILADLDDFSITSLRKFDSDEDYYKYLKFRRYALVVYPYAREAVQIFRELEYASQFMTKKEKKKKIKELQKRLENDFEEPLKNLTKLQGKILVKMVEKEMERDLYSMIKEVKGGFTAFYWHNFSKLYDYDLKEGYHRGTYHILDVVLDDFDLNHRIENSSSLKYISLSDLRSRKKR